MKCRSSSVPAATANGHRPHGFEAPNADTLAAQSAPPLPPPVWGAQRHALSAGRVKGAQVGGQTDRPGYDAGSASSQLTSLGLCPVGEAGVVLPASVRLHFARVLRAHGGGIGQRARRSQQPRDHDAEKRGPQGVAPGLTGEATGKHAGNALGPWTAGCR